MPEIGVGREYPLCPEGEDILRLKEVELKDMPAYEGVGTTPRLIWKFISRRSDPATGEFYEIAIFTPPHYTGHAKSKLTWLMRQIDKRVNKDWIKSNRLNTDQYVDRDYKTLIQHTLSEDGNKTYAMPAYLEPLTNAVSAPAAATEDITDIFDDPDPGAIVTCETCGKELTDIEAIGCAKLWGDARRLCQAHAKEQRLREAEALFTSV